MKDKEYASSTIGKIISNIKAILNHALDNDVNFSNAFIRLNSPKKRHYKEHIIYLTELEVEKITTPNPELTDSMLSVQKITIIKLETGQRLVDILGKKEGGKYTHPPTINKRFYRERRRQLYGLF